MDCTVRYCSIRVLFSLLTFINNLRYAGDKVLIAESKEEMKNLLMKVKEESEKAALKLNIQKLRSWHPVGNGKYIGKQWRH